MKLKLVVLSFLVVTAVLATSLGSFFYLNSQGNHMESVKVAYAPFESVSLFWISEEKGFFSMNGLNVTSHTYATGAGALDGMLKGEADIAVGTNEFPLTVRALNEESIRTIGSISKSEFIYLVGRKDRGIESVSDLSGKRIGTTFGTIAQFYLGRFLDLNGISLENVVLVDLKTPVEWVDAVVNGTVDAVATAQPYANSAEEGLGKNAVCWSVQSGQPLYSQAIAADEWIAENPELVLRFLKSLLQAEEFAINHPSEAKAIVKKQMSFTDEYVETVWSQNRFLLSLEQSQVLAMEDEARWMIRNGLTNATAVPNFVAYMYLDGLGSVKPGAVNIIR